MKKYLVAILLLFPVFAGAFTIVPTDNPLSEDTTSMYIGYFITASTSYDVWVNDEWIGGVPSYQLNDSANGIDCDSSNVNLGTIYSTEGCIIGTWPFVAGDEVIITESSWSEIMGEQYCGDFGTIEDCRAGDGLGLSGLTYLSEESVTISAASSSEGTTTTATSTGEYDGPNLQEWLFVACVLIFFVSLGSWRYIFRPVKEFYDD